MERIPHGGGALRPKTGRRNHARMKRLPTSLWDWAELVSKFSPFLLALAAAIAAITGAWHQLPL